MVFENYGGIFQLRLETAEDLASLGNLKESRWESEDANLCAVKEGKIDVLQNVAFRRVDTSDADERKDDLFVVCHYRNRRTSKNCGCSSQVAPLS